jgi:uncharacterized membrane protein YkoI
MKRLVFLLLALGAMAMAVPAAARHHASSRHSHASAHGGHHHGGGGHSSRRHGGRGHHGHSRRGHHAGAESAEASAPATPAISQDDAQQLALHDSPGTITSVTKTVRGRDTYYSVDIRGAEGQRRVLVDASHGKVMASIPIAQ